LDKLYTDELTTMSDQNIKERDYWLSKLEGNLEKSIIPYDLKGSNQSFKTENFTITDKLFTRMLQISKGNDIKLYMLLISGITILVNKFTNSNDVILGGPILQQNVQGTFINTALALRNQINDDMNFKDILALSKQTIIEAFQNANYPIERLIYQLELENIKDNFPLFDICVVLTNIQNKEYIKEIPVNMQIFFTRDDQCIQGQINYNSNLYIDTTIQRLIKHLNLLFEIILFDPDKKIKEIGLATENEKEKILTHFNNTAAGYPVDKSIKELFEEQAAKTPEHTAVIFEDRKLTYRELNSRANKLASILMQKGMKRNDHIPVLIEHSLELVISLLAVMKIGAAFVPVDVNWPEMRIKKIITDLNSKIVLTAREPLWQGEETDQYSFLKVQSGDLEGIEKNPEVKIDREDLIYIIYTSGSTGEPKGVMIPHRGILNRFQWMNDYFGKGSAKSVLQTTRYVYDSAVWQIFWPLINGGQVVVLPPSYTLTAENISELIKKHQVTLTDFVPSVFNMIVNQMSGTEEQKERFSSLKNIILGGEEITARTTHEFLKKYPDINITNLYGPTEVSIGSIYHQVKGDEGEQIPIGKPIANLEVYILDKNSNLMPPGISGEICLGGKGVGLGYLNNKEKSNQVFVDNPFRPGEKMYRTGDLARWDDNGSIYFLGRKDSQIKIRGFRIELREIENKILDSGLVEQSLAVVKNDANNNKYLCSYIVKKKNNLEALSSQEKIRYSRQILLKAWGEEGQTILKNTTALVVGAGGSGSTILMQLALTGFGKIIVADPDVVELSNLNRQFMHDESRIGQNKALSAKQTIERVNPNVKVTAYPGKVTQDNIAELGADADVIFDNADDGQAKIAVSKFAVAKGIPHVIASMLEMNSYAIIYNPPYTPCYHCIYDIEKLNAIKELEITDENYKKSPYPVNASSLFVSTGFAVNEVIKILLGIDEPAYNKFLLFNQVISKDIFESDGYKILTYAFSDHFKKSCIEQGYDWEEGWNGGILDEIEIKPDPQCPVCGKVHKQKQRTHEAKREDTLTLLKNYLKQHLPEYMIPAYFVELDKIPLTAGGKIDRRALPEPKMRIADAYAPPQTAMEKELVGMWAEELNIEKDIIGIDSSFFNLGGHSLKVVNLISKIQKRYAVRISLPDMFKLPTIRGISNYISNSVKEDYVSIAQAEASEYYPLSAAQRKLYSAQAIQKDSTGYNISIAAMLIGLLDIERIKEAVCRLVQRHEGLRTSFEMADNQPVQRVHTDVDFKIEYYQAAEDQILDIFKGKFVRPFDLSAAPLLRVGIIKINWEKHLLMLDIHHLIADAISIQVILRDFMALYENSGLPELNIQYKDYAVWENKLEGQSVIKKQDDYWLNIYQKEPRPLDMPVDYPRGSGVQSFAGDEVSLEIDSELTGAIKQAVLENKVTLYSYLLTAYYILLSKYTNEEDIVVGTPASGRTQADLEDIVGMFVNVLPIRSYVDGRKTFAELLGSVHENLLNALNNQNFNMDQIVKKLNIGKTLNRNLLFDTTFVLQNMEHTKIEIKGLTLETYPTKSTSTKFEIVITLVEREDCLTMWAEYSTALYTEETIERLCRHYIDILRTVVKDRNIEVDDINLPDTAGEDMESGKNVAEEELPLDL